MYADFSFLEYSYDPNVLPQPQVYGKLENMGFCLYSEHINGKITVWSQGLCIIFVRPREGFCGISGLGFISEHDLDNDPYFEYDSETNFYNTADPEGNNLFFIPSDLLTEDGNVLSKSYKRIANNYMSNSIFNRITGIIINVEHKETLYFYKHLGFKVTKQNDQYTTLISPNREVSIVITQKQNTGIQCVIFDTDDIFHTTSYMTFREFDIKKFNQMDTSNFGDLSHKILGYNCLAFGNESSYSIENFCESALPNMDVIFRMRKQFLHVCPDNLERHYV